MMVRVSPYGPHYSHRTPLAGLQEAAGSYILEAAGDDAPVAPAPVTSSIPSPGSVFGAVAGVSLAIPLVVAIGHRMFVKGSTVGSAAKAGLVAAGVLYVIGALGTAGLAAGATAAVRSASET